MAPGVVNLQVAQSVGGVAAVLAGILLDDIVDLHVASQMGRLCGLIRTSGLQTQKKKTYFLTIVLFHVHLDIEKKCIECLSDESLVE